MGIVDMFRKGSRRLVGAAHAVGLCREHVLNVLQASGLKARELGVDHISR